MDKNKYDKNNFLLTRAPYDSTYTIKDVLNEICKDIFYWVDRTPELDHDYEEETFLKKFYKFIYQTYYKGLKEDFIPYDEELYLYFTMKFSQDIIDFFMKYKEITRSYNLQLFHKKDDISLDLEQFLFSHLLIEEPYNNDCESGSDEENNISSIIDETNL